MNFQNSTNTIRFPIQEVTKILLREKTYNIIFEKFF